MPAPLNPQPYFPSLSRPSTQPPLPLSTLNPVSTPSLDPQPYLHSTSPLDPQSPSLFRSLCRSEKCFVESAPPGAAGRRSVARTPAA
eukprot:91137-Rhodomonas_salina.1